VGEIRIEPQTGEWRIVAPERAGRPIDRTRPRPAGDDGAAAHRGATDRAADCPFCPGNEAQTPPEILRVPTGGPAWRVRVVPNKYSITSPPTGPAGTPSTGPAGTPFTGDHEVVIESPEHDWDLRFASPEEAAEILFALRARCRVLADRGRAAVIAFRNHGAAAGTSLHHPHSQLVGLDHAPPGLVNRWQRARDHRARTGHRLQDDIAAAERADGSRVVADTGEVLVFQPAAAGYPHETTLFPLDAGADLAGAPDRALTAVAAILPRTLAALAAVLDDPAYNLMVHAGPAGDAGAAGWFGWQLSICPRVTTLGGLELATGLTVNPTAPEHTAPVLRQAIAAPSVDVSR
jgi:UDPglucose--hexose-1-phosphate uridylyltransferase